VAIAALAGAITRNRPLVPLTEREILPLQPPDSYVLEAQDFKTMPLDRRFTGHSEHPNQEYTELDQRRSDWPHRWSNHSARDE